MQQGDLSELNALALKIHLYQVGISRGVCNTS